MFAWFLYFYLRYRTGHLHAIVPAVVFGALAFYAYNTGQPGIVLCAGLLILVDARFHWENRRMALLGAALAVVLALPYLRFQVDHPGEVVRRLQLLDSYLVKPDLPPADKAVRFVEEYAAGLSPAYWYAPDSPQDLIRHRMKGYGNLPWPTMPFAVIGLVIALRRWRDPPYRAVLMAAFTAPIGAAIAGVLITRSLVLVVPAALLTFLGAVGLLRWLGDRLGHTRVAVALFASLSLGSGAMLWDALTNGPTWYSDYGLTGLQYGARQVFSEATDYLDEQPQSQIWIFPSAWNGSDMLRRFFAPEDDRIQLLNLDSFLEARFDAVEQAVVVLTPEDYARVVESGKFTVEEVVRRLPLPDGTIGFHLARLAYSPAADAIFAAEDQTRRSMVEEQVDLAGRVVTVRHTRFDVGSLADLFDGDRGTMARTAGTNPAVIELDFGEPVEFTGLRLTTGHSDMEVLVRFDAGAGLVPGRYEQAFTGLPPDPTLELVFDPPPGPVRTLTIEVRDLMGTATSRVHLREISLLE
jgi:hypothetical protein